MFGTCTEEVYVIHEEDNGSNKEVDKPKKTVPQTHTSYDYGGRNHILS